MDSEVMQMCHDELKEIYSNIEAIKDAAMLQNQVVVSYIPEVDADEIKRKHLERISKMDPFMKKFVLTEEEMESLAI